MPKNTEWSSTVHVLPPRYHVIGLAAKRDTITLNNVTRKAKHVGLAKSVRDFFLFWACLVGCYVMQL